MINQTLHNSVALPNQPLEGGYLKVERWLNSSGPFGREIAGDRWLPFDEAAEILATARRLCN